MAHLRGDISHAPEGGDSKECTGRAKCMRAECSIGGAIGTAAWTGPAGTAGICDSCCKPSCRSGLPKTGSTSPDQTQALRFGTGYQSLAWVMTSPSLKSIFLQQQGRTDSSADMQGTDGRILNRGQALLKYFADYTQRNKVENFVDEIAVCAELSALVQEKIDLLSCT